MKEVTGNIYYTQAKVRCVCVSRQSSSKVAIEHKGIIKLPQYFGESLIDHIQKIRDENGFDAERSFDIELSIKLSQEEEPHE